ncbi:SDR family oxidoreductase [Aestuariicella hydrocarbonica]|uniref:SDR family oxidoreductase n=1 Tax=Pseudomaricurvus hydrocarbonicus TaxID=1470433 RepID=A0A9E5JWZ2_9GAMM|nr:SDR family oxidoreductase [Aestuariicella hydrocarbonica]NHO66101.1 SDR family oxidoreductase [Aestuariicella hydrocarbonica]
MTNRVAGKVAIVTGASRGVGRADAELLSREGATVILTDVNAEAGQQAAADIGGNARFITQDVSDEAGWQALIDMVEQEYGRLDILVNNAAILKMADIKAETLEGWRRIHTVNTESIFLAIKYALPLMEKSGGGSIINMSSSSALVGMPQFAAYSSSKAAVRGLTQSVAVYCHKAGNKVRCNTVHPDGIATPMVAELAAAASSPIMDEAKGQVAASYTCLPEDVANTILFLASDESRHINGAAIRLDNSSTITPPYL